MSDSPTPADMPGAKYVKVPDEDCEMFSIDCEDGCGAPAGFYCDPSCPSLQGTDPVRKELV